MTLTSLVISRDAGSLQQSLRFCFLISSASCGFIIFFLPCSLLFCTEAYHKPNKMTLTRYRRLGQHCLLVFLPTIKGFGCNLF